MNNPTLNKANAIIQEQPRHQLGGPPQPPARMLGRIASIGRDTLYVTFGTGEQTSSQVLVAKATKVMPALQVSPMFDAAVGIITLTITDSQGLTRTSVSDDATENEAVVPPYFIGDVIEVGPAPANLYEEAMAISETELAENITLQEVNSPRYWSKID